MAVTTIETSGAADGRLYPGRAAVVSWIFFDWAAQPYFTLITTFVFAPYFAAHVAPDAASGQALWGFATAAAGIVIALLSPVLGAIADAETAVNMSRIIVPLIVVAEICSWYAVLTRNFFYNAIENSLWAVAFLFVGIGLGRLLPEFDGTVRWLLLAGLVGIACYLAFLVVVDVPMYLRRWRIEHAAGTPLLHPLDGLRDVATRWTVTHEFEHWKEEIAWMSLYFSAAVWGSLALCALSAMNDHLPSDRAQAQAQAQAQVQAAPAAIVQQR